MDMDEENISLASSPSRSCSFSPPPPPPPSPEKYIRKTDRQKKRENAAYCKDRRKKVKSGEIVRGKRPRPYAVTEVRRSQRRRQQRQQQCCQSIPLEISIESQTISPVEINPNEVDLSRVDDDSRAQSQVVSQPLEKRSSTVGAPSLRFLPKRKEAEFPPESDRISPAKSLPHKPDKIKEMKQFLLGLNIQKGSARSEAKIHSGAVVDKVIFSDCQQGPSSKDTANKDQLPPLPRLKPVPAIKLAEPNFRKSLVVSPSFDVDGSFTQNESLQDDDMDSLVEDMECMSTKGDETNYKVVKDNTIWERIDGIDLTNDQILTLLFYKEVDDSVFEALLRKTAIKLREIGGVICTVMDVCSTKIVGIRPDDEIGLDGFKNNMKSALEIEGLEVIWFPIHNMDHYYVMMADKASSIVSIFDPCQPDVSVQELEDQVLLNILEKTTEILKDLTKNLDWTFLDDKGMTHFFKYKDNFPVQEDSINCCVLCVAFIQTMFYLPEAWFPVYVKQLFNLETCALRTWLVAFLKS